MATVGSATLPALRPVQRLMIPITSELMDDHAGDLQPVTEGQLEEIFDSAAVVIESCRTNLGVNLECTAESMEWLDGYIDRLRTSGFSGAEFRKLAQGFGSLLGETLIAVYGGSWVRTDSGIGVSLEGLGIEYPFHRIVRQIECGADESIYRHFIKVPEIDWSPNPMWPAKAVVYRGGIVRFDIPAHWLEEYETEGGGTFYADIPSSGTLRLNVLGFRISPDQQLSDRMQTIMRRDGFQPLQADLGLRQRRLTGLEDGEDLIFFRWEVLIPVPPNEFSIACFAHTVLATEAETDLTRQELSFIDASVRNACYYQG